MREGVDLLLRAAGHRDGEERVIAVVVTHDEHDRVADQLGVADVVPGGTGELLGRSLAAGDGDVVDTFFRGREQVLLVVHVERVQDLVAVDARDFVVRAAAGVQLPPSSEVDTAVGATEAVVAALDVRTATGCVAVGCEVRLSGVLGEEDGTRVVELADRLRRIVRVAPHEYVDRSGTAGLGLHPYEVDLLVWAHGTRQISHLLGRAGAEPGDVVEVVRSGVGCAGAVRDRRDRFHGVLEAFVDAATEHLGGDDGVEATADNERAAHLGTVDAGVAASFGGTGIRPTRRRHVEVGGIADGRAVEVELLDCPVAGVLRVAPGHGDESCRLGRNCRSR